jgi:hypothetical protein
MMSLISMMPSQIRNLQSATCAAPTDLGLVTGSPKGRHLTSSDHSSQAAITADQ